jgi:hypothetical protein
MPPCHRIDLPYSFGMRISHMVGDTNGSLLDDDDPMEIMKSKETVEEESMKPEGIGDP